MIRFLLSLFVPFRRIIESMGADYDQFIIILRLKLTLDNRRLRANARNNSGEQTTMLVKQSLLYIFLGAMVSIGLLLIKSPFTYFYFAHIVIMVFMAMMIISEFTSVLFDTADNAIILPLPIKGNTLSLARNAHIFLYLMLMAFSLSLASAGLAFYRFGIVAGLIFLVTVFQNVLFTLFLSNTIYLLIMRLASGERLKSLLMYFQVFIAIFFMAAYQLGLRLIDKTHLDQMVLPDRWFNFLIPPAFLSGFAEAFTIPLFDGRHIIFITEAVAVPLLAFYFSVKYLSPVFDRKLADLDQGDRVTKVKKENTGEGIWYRILASLMVFDKQEKAAFRLMWVMSGRERLFKQKLLPQFGYALVFIALQFINHPVTLAELSTSRTYLFFLYIPIFISAGFTTTMTLGNNNKVAWIFKILPLESPAGLFKAFIKAAFAKFFMPFFLLVSTVVVSLWGVEKLPDILIALFANFLVTILVYYVQDLNFPFTQENFAAKGGNNFFRSIGVLLFTAIVVFIHYYLIKNFEMLRALLIPVYIGIILLVNRVLVFNKIGWREVDRVNQYA